MIAPSLLSTRKSPAMTRFLRNEKSTASSAYTPVGTSFDTYTDILSGLKQLAVPPRLERKEAVGVVRMLQGWRGVRESESQLLVFLVAFEPGTNSLGPQSSRIRPSLNATLPRTAAHGISGGRWRSQSNCNATNSLPDELDAASEEIARSRAESRSSHEPSVRMRRTFSCEVNGRKGRDDSLQAVEREGQVIRQKRADGRQADEDELQCGVVLGQLGGFDLGRRDRKVPVPSEAFLYVQAGSALFSTAEALSRRLTGGGRDA